jgi:triacylglycerol esterase/lipase EstA (alpha/beta hydrolase family)
MNHTLPMVMRNAAGQPWSAEGRSRFALTEAPKGVVIFIHGFRGNALDTWIDFPQRLPREQKASGYDLLFYGYDTREAATISAVAFRNFLTAVAEKPAAQVVNSSLPKGLTPRATKFKYQHIVIAAHSLGAVVSRLALLQCVNTKRVPLEWLSRVRLALFAPAHSGALAANIASLLLFGLPAGKVLGAVASRIYRSIYDLTPASLTLTSLERDTQKRLEVPGAAAVSRCHRAWVAHGSKDWVVIINQFLEDYQIRRMSGATHLTVCKPTDEHLEPLQFLLEVMP